MFTFDHIAIACTDLAEGIAWAADKLGVAFVQGGKHGHFGTHNMLLGMGDLYLEVIAIDPDAAPRDHAAWFDLDNFNGSPRRTNWICRSENITVASDITGPPVPLSRGDLSWDMTVPVDGSLPMQGGYPSLLQWGPGVQPPGKQLPDSGCRLQSWQVSHPQADWLRLNVPLDDPRVSFVTGDPGFRAMITTPAGLCQL